MVRDKVEINKYAKIDKDNNIINLLDETSLVNIKNYYMAKGDSRWARYAEPIFPARIANENTAFA